MSVGQNIALKKRKWKATSSSYNSEAVGKNIKWGKGEGNRNFEGKKSRFKKIIGWGRISSCRELYTPLGSCESLYYSVVVEIKLYGKTYTATSVVCFLVVSVYPPVSSSEGFLGRFSDFHPPL